MFRVKVCISGDATIHSETLTRYQSIENIGRDFTLKIWHAMMKNNKRSHYQKVYNYYKTCFCSAALPLPI